VGKKKKKRGECSYVKREEENRGYRFNGLVGKALMVKKMAPQEKWQYLWTAFPRIQYWGL
jgi:hypothetical protein